MKAVGITERQWLLVMTMMKKFDAIIDWANEGIDDGWCDRKAGHGKIDETCWPVVLMIPGKRKNSLMQVTADWRFKLSIDEIDAKRWTVKQKSIVQVTWRLTVMMTVTIDDHYIFIELEAVLWTNEQRKWRWWVIGVFWWPKWQSETDEIMTDGDSVAEIDDDGTGMMMTWWRWAIVYRAVEGIDIVMLKWCYWRH